MTAVPSCASVPRTEFCRLWRLADRSRRTATANHRKAGAAANGREATVDGWRIAALALGWRRSCHGVPKRGAGDQGRDDVRDLHAYRDHGLLEAPTQRTACRLQRLAARSSAADQQAHPARLHPRQHRRAPRRPNPVASGGPGKLLHVKYAAGAGREWHGERAHRGPVDGALRRDRRIAHRWDGACRAHRSDRPRWRAARAALPRPASPTAFRAGPGGSSEANIPLEGTIAQSSMIAKAVQPIARPLKVIYMADQLLQDPEIRHARRRLRQRARDRRWTGRLRPLAEGIVGDELTLAMDDEIRKHLKHLIDGLLVETGRRGQASDDAATEDERVRALRTTVLVSDADARTWHSATDQTLERPNKDTPRSPPGEGRPAGRGRKRLRRPRGPGACRRWPSVRGRHVAAGADVEVGAVLVEPDQGGVDVVGRELGHDRVEHHHRGGVPDVRVVQVNDWAPIGLIGVIRTGR